MTTTASTMPSIKPKVGHSDLMTPRIVDQWMDSENEPQRVPCPWLDQDNEVPWSQK